MQIALRIAPIILISGISTAAAQELVAWRPRYEATLAVRLTEAPWSPLISARRVRFRPATNAQVMQSTVKRVADRLLARNKLRPDLVSVRLEGCEAVTAETDPMARSIRVCRGLAARLEDEDQLAFVIAHEIGHVILQHPVAPRDVLQDGTSAAWGAVALGALAAGAASATGPIGAVAALGFFTAMPDLMNQHNGLLKDVNRKEEAEADAVGLELMSVAGYNPSAALKYVRRFTDNQYATVIAASGSLPGREKARDQWYTSHDNTYRTKKLIEPTFINKPNLNSHPSGQDRALRLGELVRANFSEARNVKLTELKYGSETKKYWDALSTVDRGLPPPSPYTQDYNLQLRRARIAMHRGDYRSAFSAVESLPLRFDLPDRNLRLARIAYVGLHDPGLTRTYFNQHVTSGEWKNMQYVEPKPDSSIAFLALNSDEQRSFEKLWCALKGYDDCKIRQGTLDTDQSAREAGYSNVVELELDALKWDR